MSLSSLAVMLSYSFNRTNVELKFVCVADHEAGDLLPFNRTNVELKLGDLLVRLVYVELLIVPMWN